MFPTNLTPDPSPARDIRRPLKRFMAGEGRIGERGLRPLFNSLPLSKYLSNQHKKISPFEREIKGVSKKITICKQNLKCSQLTNT